MQFSLNKEQKLKAYNEALKDLENGLILRLGVLGVDPDVFDEESFIPEENSTAQQDIFNIITRINLVKEKIQNINSI